MKRIHSLFYALAAVFLFAQCDKIEEPFREGMQKVSVDTVTFEEKTDFMRKYLFEEFTGHTCINCPKGHLIIQEMQETMGDSLICMAIHSGSNAEPEDGLFKADFRTDLGKYLATYFSVTNYPCGMINRQKIDGKILQNYTTWKAKMAALARTAPEVGLQIRDTAVDMYPDSAFVFVKVSLLQPTQRNLRLYVVLLEDGIVSPQKNGLATDTSYVHNHMLRASLSPLEGTVMDVSGALGQEKSAIYAYSLYRKSLWNWKNCSFLAFVCDADSEEVLQAEICHCN